MKNDDKKGWKMVWSAVALMVLSCLLMALSLTPETFGLHGIPYYLLMIALIAAEVSLVYHIARTYFGKKNK